jgi:putative ABC transport system ATP-binding protein
MINPAAPIIRLERVTKDYPMGDGTVCALRGIDLTIDANELLAIMGPSGSGKSTLMNIIGCLDVPTSGQYWLEGEDVAQLSHSQLALVRGRRIGFVFQTFEMMPRQTALRNVEMPLIYAGVRDRRERAAEALRRVGLADRMGHRPNQMSGGQRQRVAIARALVQHPSILLADEPTGNLDSRTGDEILELFADLHEQGQTILIVTHEPAVASLCQRVVHVRDGLIERDEMIGDHTLESLALYQPGSRRLEKI